MARLARTSGHGASRINELVSWRISTLESGNALSEQNERDVLFLAERIDGRHLFAARIVRHRKAWLEGRSS
jgi:hypothetical protein